MAFVITQPCIGTKDAACVEVCPVDCIHPVPSSDQYEEVAQLYIDPDECIDCGACEPECPVDAILPRRGRAGGVGLVHTKRTPTGTGSPPKSSRTKWNDAGRKE